MVETVVGLCDHPEQRLNGKYFLGYDSFYLKQLFVDVSKKEINSS
jgi:hypothetical protein